MRSRWVVGARPHPVVAVARREADRLALPLIVVRILPALTVAALLVAGLWWGAAQVTGAHGAGVPAASDMVVTARSSGQTVATPARASGPLAPAPGAAEAVSRCEQRLAQYAGPDNPMHVSLQAAYPATAEDVAVADERRHGGSYDSPWRDRAADEVEAVCFFDAKEFGVTAPVTSGGPTRPDVYNRLEEIVRPDGTPVGYTAGFRRSMAVEPIPPAGRS